MVGIQREHAKESPPALEMEPLPKGAGTLHASGRKLAFPKFKTPFHAASVG